VAITPTGRRYTVRVPGALALLLDEVLRSGDFGRNVADVFLCGLRKVVLQYKDRVADREELAKTSEMVSAPDTGAIAEGSAVQQGGGKGKPRGGKNTRKTKGTAKPTGKLRGDRKGSVSR